MQSDMYSVEHIVVVVVDPTARSGGVIVVLHATNRLCSLNIVPAGGGVQLRGGDCHKGQSQHSGQSQPWVAVFTRSGCERLRSGLCLKARNSDQTPSDADDA